MSGYLPVCLFSLKVFAPNGGITQLLPFRVIIVDCFLLIHPSFPSGVARLLKVGGQRRRRRRRQIRDAEGVEWRDAEGIEGVGNEEGVSPSPADYGVWGSVVSSPSGVRGGAPAENEFGAFWSCQKAIGGNHFEYSAVYVLQ